jgi:hypothetical protein
LLRLISLTLEVNAVIKKTNVTIHIIISAAYLAVFLGIDKPMIALVIAVSHALLAWEAASTKRARS